MDEDRRQGERRHNPDAWTEAHRYQVRMVYGMVIGGLMIFAGIVILVWAVTNEVVGHGRGIKMIAGALIGGGLVAGNPTTFMPLLSRTLDRLPFFAPANAPPPPAVSRDGEP